MTTRSQQRVIMLGSLAAGAISLGVIGYLLVAAWLNSSETQVAQSVAMPAPQQKQKIQPIPKKKKIAQQVKEPEPEIESGPSVIKTAEAAVEAPTEKLKLKTKPLPATKVEEKVAVNTPAQEKQPQKKLTKTETKKIDEIETKPARPYEDTLPGDVYEPPIIKIPKRKPKVSKARRIKRKSKNKKVRSSRLTALKWSQLPPWRRYAARVPRKKENKGKPKIVIVIDDMEVDRKRSKKIVALPGPLTLSYLTYAKSLYKQTRKARKAGHEIMLHRYVGINNHMGSKFTTDRYGMTIVMKELRRRGLLFLDSRTTNKSVGGVIAHAVGVPYAERNIFLDNVNKLKAVQDRLAELERLARRRGKAIAIGHPRDATIEALSTWLDEIKTRGFVIVPITSIVHVPK